MENISIHGDLNAAFDLCESFACEKHSPACTEETGAIGSVCSANIEKDNCVTGLSDPVAEIVTHLGFFPVSINHCVRYGNRARKF